MFVLSAVSQSMVRKRSVLYSLTIGCLLILLGLAGLAGALRVNSVLLLLLSAGLIGLGHGPLYAGSLARLNERIEGEGRGDIVSAYYVFTYIGVSVPILGVGWLADRIGLLPAIYGFVSVLIVLLCLSLARWLRYSRE